MLDVHPPHAAAHTWRDFFIHIATIVVGLCIAVALEQTVEFFHHRHIVHQARENVLEEVRANEVILTDDRRAMASSLTQLRNGVTLLEHRDTGNASFAKVVFSLQWNSPSNAAYTTARDTGALALMPYEEVQRYTGTYYQQSLVIDQALIYLRHANAAGAPLQSAGGLAALTPSQVTAVSQAANETISDIRFLQVLVKGLEENYASLLKS